MAYEKSVVMLLVGLLLVASIQFVVAERFIVRTVEPVHDNPLMIQTAAASSTLSTANAVGEIVKSLPRFI